MKIASWNVNGIRASYNKGLLEFIKKTQPDILCLQETKAHPDQLGAEFHNLGHYNHSYWSHSDTKKGYSGTATYTKTPCLKLKKGMGIKKFDREGRFVITEYSSFILLNIYFPNGALGEERHAFKQEFLSRLLVFLKNLEERSKKDLIIVGDYNVAYLNIDVHSPKTLSETSGFLPEERAWFKNDFLQSNFIDLFRIFYPEKQNIYTWWSYRQNARKNNKGWRIDYICVSNKLKSCAKSIEIYDKQMGSDHAPILADFGLTI